MSKRQRTDLSAAAESGQFHGLDALHPDHGKDGCVFSKIRKFKIDDDFIE